MKKKSFNRHKSKYLTTINAHPLHNEPAFIIENFKSSKKNALVLADLHYGIEHSLAQAGAHVPSQTEKITNKIIKLCSKFSVKNLILLGDIKHTVPGTSKQEWYELPEVFKEIGKLVDRIEIIPGNHDGGLRRILHDNLSNIKFHPNSGYVISNIGFFHGHTWPSPSVLETSIVLMAHNHPHVLFVDKLGGRASFPCWIRARLDIKRATERYPQADGYNPEIIIMPAFNDLGSGTPITTPKPEFLGPMLRNQIIDTEKAEIYLLDGTALGKLRDLKDLNIEDDFSKRKFKKFSKYLTKTKKGER